MLPSEARSATPSVPPRHSPWYCCRPVMRPMPLGSDDARCDASLSPRYAGFVRVVPACLKFPADSVPRDTPPPGGPRSPQACMRRPGPTRLGRRRYGSGDGDLRVLLESGSSADAFVAVDQPAPEISAASAESCGLRPGKCRSTARPADAPGRRAGLVLTPDVTWRTVDGGAGEPVQLATHRWVDRPTRPDRQDRPPAPTSSYEPAARAFVRHCEHRHAPIARPCRQAATARSNPGLRRDRGRCRAAQAIAASASTSPPRSCSRSSGEAA